MRQVLIYARQRLLHRVDDLITRNATPASDPDDQILHCFGRRGNNRFRIEDISDANSQLIRPSLVPTQETYGPSCAYIEHNDRWIGKLTGDASG
jgi:hypothetical protein